jgi:hypothetical protein
VLIGFNDNFLTPAPTWTVVDSTAHLVASIEIHRGRQTLADQTNTGTATVFLNDTAGLFDPANVSSPYYGKIDGKPIMLQCWNPVTSTWIPQFRGTIDEYGYDLNPTQVVSNIQLDCVDVFDYLGGYELMPGADGKTPPAGSEGTICYYGATSATAQNIQDRIVEILTDAHIDPTMTVVFTGNVQLQVTKYDPGEAALTALRDAVDAELPTIGNIYVDKIGRFVFHGRGSRFDPDTVSAGASPGAWNFRRWKVGDHTAIVSDATRAQVRVLATQRARSSMINRGICWPRGIAETGMANQVYEDSAAGTQYGKYSWTAGDLITYFSATTGNYATTECKNFATFKVKNTKDPQTAIRTLTMKSLPPGDSRASATWGCLTGVDISDIVNVSVGYPGGTGIQNTEFYVEGVTMRINPSGDTRYDLVEVDLDVSPAVWSQDTHHVLS